MEKTKMKYTQLKAVNILKDDEDLLEEEEFIKRAQALTKGTMDDKALEFYEKKENWSLLPDCNYLFFADTVFRGPGGHRLVQFLFRVGSEWLRFSAWLDDRFTRHYRVAVLASSLDSDTNPSDLEERVKTLEEEMKAIRKFLVF